MNPEVFCDEAMTLGESPVWCDQAAALYCVDIRAPALYRLAPGGPSARWALPELCGGVALGPHPCVVLALTSGLYLFDTQTAELSRLAALDPPERGNRLNDIKVDRRGRIWCGTMRDFGAATTGALYRVGPRLSPEAVLVNITIPNALCWSPDDATFYFADSAEGRLRAYPFDLESGTLGSPRVLIDADAVAGKPDGATVDADGCIWNARFGAGQVVRVAPDGRIDRVIHLPVAQVTSCGFGGPDRRTLFVTTARQRLTAPEFAAQPLAGQVFAVQTVVAGLPEPRFLPGVPVNRLP